MRAAVVNQFRPQKSVESDGSDRASSQKRILLTANLDIPFEKGVVSFEDHGRMLVSTELSASDRPLFGLPKKLRRKPDAGEQRYLAQHRKSFNFPA